MIETQTIIQTINFRQGQSTQNSHSGLGGVAWERMEMVNPMIMLLCVTQGEEGHQTVNIRYMYLTEEFCCRVSIYISIYNMHKHNKTHNHREN